MNTNINKKNEGGVTMNNKNLKSLDLNKLKDKKTTIISSENALKDVTPIDWDEDVLSGKKKVTLCKAN